MHLTPAMLVTSYELLRTTPPFKGWRLPEADAVQFTVSRHVDLRGQYQCATEWVGGTLRESHHIWISGRCISTMDSLIRAMAHEMTHLADRLRGFRGNALHGASWQKHADAVCKRHKFDRALF